ncbi:hypothetical protein P4C99_05500 [Pontiellaceae bacterium B1224]|nr:hypothetical protein [Pontiellaceae bacterium B1224]
MSDLLPPITEFNLPNLNFDSAQLNDPVAEITDWSPLVSGGSKTVTRILKQINPDRIAFRPSSSIIASVVIGFIMFIGMAGIPIAQMLRKGVFEFSLLPFIGLFFAGVGCYAFYRFCSPVTFDRREDAFWKGWKSPDKVIRKDELKSYTAFDQIHALQIIRELCEQKSSSSSGTSRTEQYYSYELNFVLQDGARINITEHGNQSRIRDDAKHLSEFLKKQLWDATV